MEIRRAKHVRKPRSEYWIEYDGKDYDSDMGQKYIFYYGEEQYDAILMDLPTITVYKTLDDKTLYKSNNICQVLVVAPTPRILDPESNTYVQVEKQRDYSVLMASHQLAKMFTTGFMSQ